MWQDDAEAKELAASQAAGGTLTHEQIARRRTHSMPGFAYAFFLQRFGLRTLSEHNLAELLRAGIRATVNSDDPAYFGGYVNDNFVATFEALPDLGAADAYALARNSFEASFADRATVQTLVGRLDATFTRFAEAAAT
jgi:hypothetical protein